MKILFIAFHYNNFCGGSVCSLRNVNALKDLYGSENVWEFRISRSKSLKNINKYFWYFQGLWNDIKMCSIGGYDSKQQKAICNLIKENKIDLVYIDNSGIGNIARFLKRLFSQIRIITFFHNVEYLYYKKEFEVKSNHLLKYRNYILKKNEQNACLYSDKIIALNFRDSEIIKKLYNRTPDNIIPITLKDSYCHSKESTRKNEIKTGLFVGSYFSLNVEGISFFIREVLYKTDMKLVVVGSGMEELKNRFKEDSQLEIHDFVPELKCYYELADFVIMPLLSGSGMKVKTAEALMYGKYIIGSTEAFVGYFIDFTIGTSCKNAEEFIQAINLFALKENRFNLASRKLYLREHINGISLKQFKFVIDSIK